MMGFRKLLFPVRVEIQLDRNLQTNKLKNLNLCLHNRACHTSNNFSRCLCLNFSNPGGAFHRKMSLLVHPRHL